MKQEKISISAAILAGGKSSRMGENKALLKIGRDRIIDKLTKELGMFSELLVSVASKGDYEDLGLKLVYDENRDIGPIEGLRRVLSAAENEYVFVCAVDMPNITAEFVRCLSLFTKSGDDCYVITDEDHIQPLCAIYKKSCLPVIEKLISEGNYRLRKIFDAVSTVYISIEDLNFTKKTVKNINTREDYNELMKPFVFAVSGYSDAGKTGLIERLINEFKKEGMSVCAIKHDGHDILSDKPGSDTERFYSAGADISAAFTDSETIVRSRETTTVEQLIKRISDALSPDFIILEGLKNSSYPKIEIVRKEIHDKSICRPETLICIASDCLNPADFSCPVFGLTDIDGMFLCLKEYFDIKE